MAPTALLMIHNPATMAFGDHNEMQKAIEMLSEVKESIINDYELKTGLSRAKLDHLMEDETWMNAKKAIELHFADGMLEDEKKMSADVGAYQFSSKQVENALLNKITEKTQVSEPKKVELEVTGRSVDELMDRLNLMKY